MEKYTTVPTDFRRCGACIYWLGEKEVNGKLVNYDINSFGRCNNFKSSAHGEIVSADHYCFSKKDY